MKIDWVLVIAGAGLLTAGVLLYFWWKGAPEAVDLRRHTGRLIERRIVQKGRTGYEMLRLRIDGLQRALHHAPDRSNYDRIKQTLREGDQLRVSFDSRGGLGSGVLYGLEREGAVLLQESDMIAWSVSNLRWCLFVVPVLVLISGFLGWISWAGHREAAKTATG